jgi:hypothetical protein
MGGRASSAVQRRRSSMSTACRHQPLPPLGPTGKEEPELRVVVLLSHFWPI